MKTCLRWKNVVQLSVKKKKISHRHCIGPLRGSSFPFSALSRRGLNPIKPVYDQVSPDIRLNLTASAFNQLGQYTSSPGGRGYCYAELAVFFPIGGRNHRQYSLRLPTEAVTQPSTNRAQCRATALIETDALPLHQTDN